MTIVHLQKLVHWELLDNNIAVITLNRPDKMNALSREMILELKNILIDLKALSPSELSCVVLKSSTPKAFCSGADLKERSSMNVEQIREHLKFQRDLMDQLSALPVPTVAAVEGLAFGGGFELALCCDIRVSSSSTQLGLIELRLGIIPGAGGTQRLSRLVGAAKAKEMMFRAQKISGTEAFELKIVNELSEKPTDTALQIAQEICKAGPLALRAAKQAVDEGVNLSLSEGLDTELKYYELVLESQDRLEGIAAFLEKRTPKFKGI